MKKFVLITGEKCGGNLLRRLLSDHKQIDCDGEWFRKEKEVSNRALMENIYDKERNPAIRVVGFVLKYNRTEKWMIDFFVENKIKIIQITRDLNEDWLKEFSNSHDNIVEYKKRLESDRKYYKAIRSSVISYNDIVLENNIWVNHEVRRPFLKAFGVVDKKLKLSNINFRTD